MAGPTEADMVLELLKAIQRHGPRPTARLSPVTEHAYAQAEAMRHQLPEVA